MNPQQKVLEKITYQYFRTKVNEYYEQPQIQRFSQSSVILSEPKIPIQRFTQKYYFSYGSAKFLEVILPYLQQNIKKIIQKTSTDHQLFQRICHKDITLLLEINIINLQKVQMKYLGESLNLFQNIFNFPMDEWNKFINTSTFIGIKSFFQNQRQKIKIKCLKILKKINEIRICRKCKQSLTQLIKQEQKSLPLMKFIGLYKENLYGLLYVFNERAQKQNHDYLRAAVFLVYSITMNQLKNFHPKKSEFRHLFRYFEQNIKNYQGKFCDYQVYYDFVTNSQIKLLNRHFNVLIQTMNQI